MLQDRKRPFWPFALGSIPYAVLLGLYSANLDSGFLNLVIAYFLLLYVAFVVYMVSAVRQYGRWLRDNYADLEHKEVWQSFIVIIASSVLVVIYGVDTGNIFLGFLTQLVGLAFIGLLLWRVETLQQLEVVTDQDEPEQDAPVQDTPVQAPTAQSPTEVPSEEEVEPSAIDSDIEQLLESHCVEAQLYLQHDLSLSQLAQVIGTNHYYLSQYFTQKDLTYNAYINGLRIRHFINLYHEAVASQRTFTAQQLASESGFRSYSTFSVAFKQRMGQTVTAWMSDTANVE